MFRINSARLQFASSVHAFETSSRLVGFEALTAQCVAPFSSVEALRRLILQVEELTRQATIKK
jgi:hypothetical protein